MRSPSSPAPLLRRRLLVEAALAYGGATGVAAVLYRVPGLDSWFHVVVAAMFLYLPVWLLRREELDAFGLVASPVGRNLAFALVVSLAVFPPFLVGYLAFQKIACAVPMLRSLASVPCRPGGLFPHAVVRLPPNLVSLDPGRNLLLAELVVVALPEELFFRGYLQTRLAMAFTPARRLLGAPVGGALVLTSALFALTHLAVQGNPSTLAVFFPGLLFGWMRARAGSILPGVVFHAACNLYIEALGRSFLG